MEGYRADPYSIVRDILCRWWMILFAAMMAASVAFVVVSETYRPQYTTRTTYVVSAKGNSATVYSNLTAASELAGVFSRVLSSNALKQKVADELGMKEFEGNVKAELIPETNLLVLEVTADSPKLAFDMTRAVIENHHIVTDQILNEAVMQILQKPVVPASPDIPIQNKEWAVRIGLITAVVCILLLGVKSYYSDTIKNERAAAEKLDVPLIETVYHEQKYKSLKAYILKKKCSILVVNPTTSFRFVETFKNMRTSIEHKLRTRGAKVILITSLLENEGKSTVAANLALSLAQKDKKVLLVDGDMIEPAQHKILGCRTENRPDLYRFLISDNIDFERAYMPEYKMYFIHSRYSHRSADQLDSSEMRHFIETASEQMDYVIIDSPPFSVAPDAECISSYADAAIMVVRQGVSEAKYINDAIDDMKNSGTDVIGCIFNNVHVFSLSAYTGGYGKYGNYKYGYGNRANGTSGTDKA